MGGNEEIVVADGLAGALQRDADVCVVLVGGFVERKDRQSGK